MIFDGPEFDIMYSENPVKIDIYLAICLCLNTYYIDHDTFFCFVYDKVKLMIIEVKWSLGFL